MEHSECGNYAPTFTIISLIITLQPSIIGTVEEAILKTRQTKRFHLSAADHISYCQLCLQLCLTKHPFSAPDAADGKAPEAVNICRLGPATKEGY